MLEFAPIEYVAHSNTDTILYGDELENGMRVLIEDTLFRGDPANAGSVTNSQERVNETAAWCTVTKFKFGGVIRFVGLYDDGTMRVRQYARSIAWIVKLDSIPESE